MLGLDKKLIKGLIFLFTQSLEKIIKQNQLSSNDNERRKK